MLADDVLAAARAPTADPAEELYATCLRDLSGRIGTAVRYALERDVVEAAVHHCTTRPSNIVKVLPLVRPPNARTWIEWADADKSAAMTAFGIVPASGKSAPHRVGVLLTATRPDASVFSAELAWRFPHGLVNFSPLALYFSVVDPWPNLDLDGMLEDARMYAQSPACSYHAYRNDGRELEAVIHASRHWIPGPASCASALRAGLEAMPNGPTMIDQMDREAMGDLSSEVMFLTATLLLMATVNGTRRQVEDRERLNRARIKRGGHPLLGFSSVRMRLSRSEQLASDVESAGGAKARHICRGHAKLRKRSDGSGRLYWWSDHWRGRGLGMRLPPPTKFVGV